MCAMQALALNSFSSIPFSISHTNTQTPTISISIRNGGGQGHTVQRRRGAAAAGGGARLRGGVREGEPPRLRQRGGGVHDQRVLYVPRRQAAALWPWRRPHHCRARPRCLRRPHPSAAPPPRRRREGGAGGVRGGEVPGRDRDGDGVPHQRIAGAAAEKGRSSVALISALPFYN